MSILKHKSSLSPEVRREAPWFGSFIVILTMGLAFVIYGATVAPGLSWMHFGTDGGELLAAAVRNGIPHPPGYPLYMLLLRAWLWLIGLLLPGSDLAWRGNLLSTCCAAFAAGVTVTVASSLLKPSPLRWYWAGLAGLGWVVAPLPWSQAVITEVYALHLLLIGLLVWALLVKKAKPVWLALAVALGVANHLTIFLLLPAVLYGGWRQRGGNLAALVQTTAILAVGVMAGFLFYLRIPWVAAGDGHPPPVNWGYATNWEGFWWLISGAAYRSYLFGAPSATIFGRVTAWANVITTQFTPVGLAVALAGLSQWDRHHPWLRNFSLLWVVPISVYAINYYTRDSEIYLLPVIWLMVLWLAVGFEVCQEWLQMWRVGQSAKGRPLAQVRVWMQPSMLFAFCLLVGILLLTTWRWSTISARHDTQARQFLDGAKTVLEPHSIVISSADAETFTLWYGAWATGELLSSTPDLVLINYALLQFEWYRRLAATLYPDVVGDSRSIEEILARNAERRPIFFSEKLPIAPAEQLEQIGPFWRYHP